MGVILHFTIAIPFMVQIQHHYLVKHYLIALTPFSAYLVPSLHPAVTII